MRNPIILLREAPKTLADNWAATFATAVIVGAIAATCIDVAETRTVSGQVVPAGRVRALSAPAEGGLVLKHLVREGEKVKAGQALVELDPTAAGADAAASEKELMALLADVRRLEAERDGKPINTEGLSAELASRAKADLASRHAARLSELAALQAEASAASRELAPLNAKLEQQMVGAAKGAVAVNMMRETASRVEALRGKIGTAQAQIAAKKAAHEAQTMADLAQAQRDHDITEEAVRKAKSAAAHTVLTAPVAGIVKSLKIAEGASAKPNEPVVDLVPEGGQVVELRISPEDKGDIPSNADVRLAHGRRAAPWDAWIPGQITLISADTERDERTGEHYYKATAIAGADAWIEHGKRIELSPGNPVTANIVIGYRPWLQQQLKAVIGG